MDKQRAVRQVQFGNVSLMPSPLVNAPDMNRPELLDRSIIFASDPQFIYQGGAAHNWGTPPRVPLYRPQTENNMAMGSYGYNVPQDLGHYNHHYNNQVLIGPSQQSTHQRAHQGTHQSPHQSHHQSPHQSAHQSTPQSTHQSTHQSARQSAHQSARQSAHQSAHQSPHQSTHQSTHQSAYQSTHQSTLKPPLIKARNNLRPNNQNTRFMPSNPEWFPLDDGISDSPLTRLDHKINDTTQRRRLPYFDQLCPDP